jgi:hypothetical protein
MKKTLAILLALALVFSSITVAFAEETLPADAKSVKDLGMLVGTGNGVTLDYLKETPSRISAAVMFLRLKGLEDEAKAFTGTDNFADANTAAWAAPIMAYLKANPNLGWIGNAGNFDPNGQMDAKSYYKVMLEALGYKQNTAEVIGDFTFPNVIQFAGTKGLVKVAAVTNFTVGDLATATVEALKATVKGSEKTLAASLVDAKVITLEAAIAAGVYTAPVVALEVKSVKALTLTQLEVVFSTTVDKDLAEETDYYEIEDSVITFDDAELQADGKTVLLTVDTFDTVNDDYTYELAFANDEEYTLVIDGDLVEAEVDFATADTTIPVAQSIKLTGPSTFEITFSEPVAMDLSAPAIEVEDGVYSADTATFDGSNVVEIDLGVSELEEGKYDVEVSGFRDYADFGAMKKTFVLDYVKDTKAPVPTVVEADQNEVEIDFGKTVTDEDGNFITDVDSEYFYHSYAKYTPDSIAWNASHSKATLTFDTNPLPEGNVKVVVDYNGNTDVDSVITDLWGNEMAGNAVFTVAITADDTKPTVTKIDVKDEDTIRVYFSEGLGDGEVAYATSDVLDDEEDLFLIKKDGKEITVDFTATYNADDDYVTLQFDEKLDGAYTVEISEIYDDALVANEIAKVTLSFNVTDKTGLDYDVANAVIIEAVDGDSADYIYVRFDDNMATTGVYSVLSKDNYQFEFTTKVDATADDIYELDKADTIVTFNGNDAVKITIADEDLYAVENGGVALLGRLADADNNVSQQLSAEETIIAATEPVIVADGVEMTTYKTIEVTFDRVVTSAMASAFRIFHTVDGVVSSDVAASVKLVADEDVNENPITIAVLTLKSAQQLADDEDTEFDLASGETVSVSIIGSVKADTGMTADLTDADNILQVATDGMSPEYDAKAVVDANTFTLTFTEAIAATTYAGFDLVVKDSDGETLVANDDYTVSIAGAVLTIDVLGLDVDEDIDNYSVASVASPKYIKDALGNKLKAFTAKDLDI